VYRYRTWVGVDALRERERQTGREERGERREESGGHGGFWHYYVKKTLRC